MRGQPPYISDISKVYGFSRQTYYDKSSALGLTKADWLDPSVAFSKMLERGSTCPVRRKLSNPTTRARIQKQISKLL